MASFAFNYLVADTYRVAVDILSLRQTCGPRSTWTDQYTQRRHHHPGAGQNVTNRNFGIKAAPAWPA